MALETYVDSAIDLMIGVIMLIGALVGTTDSPQKRSIRPRHRRPSAKIYFIDKPMHYKKLAESP